MRNKGLKRLLFLIAILSLLCAGCSNGSAEKEAESTNASTNVDVKSVDWVDYSNDLYAVSFKYPSGWKLDPLYSPSIRFTGEEGFVQLGAGGTGQLGLEEFASSNANHKLSPYGTHPNVTKLKVGGQVAVLIIPSADQGTEMKGQACLIVQYPKAVKIGGTSYNYFILYSDVTHIEAIAATVRFQ
jgi:hypothetical protein